MIGSPAKPMTYQELKDALNELSNEQLEMNVTVLLLGKRKLVNGYETILFSELPSKFQDKLQEQVSEDIPLITIDEVD